MLKMKQLSLSGYKSIRSMANLEFGPLTVLIGANGAGKSNLVDFFRMLNFMMTGALQDFIGRSGGAQSLLHYGPKMTPQITAMLEMETEQGVNQYACRLSYAAGDTLIFTDEQAGFTPWNRPGMTRVSLGAGHRETLLRQVADSPARFMNWALSRLRVYQFHDTSEESRLRATCEIDDNRFLYANAGNLASMLYRLRQEHPGRYERLLDTIRLVAPFLDDFVLEPMSRQSRLSLRWRGRRSEYEFGPHHLSDGTLRFLALAFLLLQPADWLPSLIIVDEPELGLHPMALATLAGMLQDAAMATQILVVTQSAALVDYFEPSHLLIAEREDGASIFRRLDDEKMRLWLTDYALGDMWQRNLMPGGVMHE